MKNHSNIASKVQQLAVVTFKLQLPNLNLKRTLNRSSPIQVCFYCKFAVTCDTHVSRLF